MKKLHLLLLMFFICVISAKAQMTFSANPFNESYHAFVKIAIEHYNKKEYKQAAENYSKAFAANRGGALDDRIKMAGCWAMADIKDSAFKELRKLESARYSKYNELQLNPDLASLHKDGRWTEICAFVKANRIKYNSQLNKSLVETLDTVLQNDQKYRMTEKEIKDKYGDTSKEINELHQQIKYYDSVNLAKVLSILDIHGWPSSSVIGDEGSTALFLVIQHADLKVQEKYLSPIRTAVQQRNIPRSFLALLEDRILVSHGKKQLYGTQVGTDDKGKHYLEPLEDPDNVDARRAEAGLSPLAEYLKEWNIAWPEKK